MNSRTSALLEALLSGDSAECLQSEVIALPSTARGDFLCSICCMRDEIAANCSAPAEEADKILALNGHRLPPSLCGCRDLNDGGCLLTTAMQPASEAQEGRQVD